MTQPADDDRFPFRANNREIRGAPGNSIGFGQQSRVLVDRLDRAERKIHHCRTRRALSAEESHSRKETER